MHHRWGFLALYADVWLPYTLFILFYGARSPWRATATGRGLMACSASIVAVLTNTLVVLAVGDYRWRVVVSACLLVAVAVAGWYQLFNLLRLQADDARESHRISEETS